MTALPGASARVRTPALEDDPALDALFERRDYTALAPQVAGGIICVGALALDTAKQAAPLLAGLSVYAELADRVEALRVWAEVAGDVALGEHDDDQYQANRLALAGVLAGLLPGLHPGRCGSPLDELELAEEDLTAAGQRVARLALHEKRGTYPKYLPGNGSVQDAFVADQTHAAWELRDLAREWAGRWDGGPRR